MKKLLIANWKENPKSEAEALKLFKEIARAPRGKGVTVAVCPPFLFLEEVAAEYRKMGAAAKKNLALGVQDVFWEERGAFTSEIGPKMVKSLGVTYVIVGHSERRKYLKETDAMINRKIKLALEDGLNVVLCVGEPLAIRKKGVAAAKAYVKNQLKKDLAGLVIKNHLKIKNWKLKIAIAYEPIWAIGSGRSDEPQDAQEMAKFINKTVDLSMLYGGSVRSENVRDYVQYKEVNGALVGGASLDAKEFKKIITITHG